MNTTERDTKRMFLTLFGALVALCMSMSVWAQDATVTVGDGTVSSYISPFNNYYKHSWTECIYQASDIDQSGTIYRVGWDCSTAVPFTMSTMKIYMGTTTNSTHNDNYSWMPLNQLTLVYSGTNIVTPSSSGWYYVDLDTSFQYSDNENLVVVVAKTAPEYTSQLKYYCTTSNDAVLYRRGDTYTSYAQHPGSQPGTRSPDLANIKLFMSSVWGCPSPQNITVSNITTESASVSWSGNSLCNSWIVGCGPTVEAAYSNVFTVTDTFAFFENLSPESEYYVVVRSVCDTDSSNWKSQLFKTDCAGNYISGGCFDLTNLSNPAITCTYGDFYDPYYNTGIIPNRHMVITTSEFDPHTNNTLPTIPDCRNYSVRLGNDNTGAQAESISVNYLVDTTQADLLILQYAVVMQNPNHTPEDQPRFTLEILNSSNQLIDPLCGYDDFVASSGLGWSSYGSVIWNEWTTVGMDLSAYHGQNVKVRLTTRDCERGGHYGYAYFLLDCGSKRMKSDFCGVDTLRTFIAPTGFRYQWYWESNPDSIISTSRSVTFSEQYNERIYCKVTSLSKDSCYFTIYGSFEPRYPIANFSSTVNQCTRTCQFHNESLVSADGITPNSYYEPCDNALWDFGDGTVSQQYNPTHVYENPGTYQVRLISGLHNFSCSDTTYQTVTFPSFIQQKDTSSCSPVLINNIQYSVSGDYTQNLTSSQGCDSVLHLHVDIHEPYFAEETVTACETYTWQNQEYIQSGDYSRNFQTIHGCDSMLTLHLTIAHHATTDIYDTACENYVWNGVTYYESGDYVQLFQTSLGCDSTVTLHLYVGHDTTTEFSAIACESYEWNDITYSSSGDYDQHLFTNLGCDSLVILHLSVGSPSTTYIEDTICSGDNYDRYNFHIPASVTFDLEEFETVQQATSIYGCDSSIYLQLTVFDTSLSIIPQGNNFCEDMSEVLLVDGSFTDYIWSTGDVTDMITVFEPGIYSVTASSMQCSAKASYTILPCDIVIFAPNAITASKSDGINDYFSIKSTHLSRIKDFEIIIFNRWGEQVFSSNDKYFYWDGKVNGKIYPDTIYQYIIRYKSESGKSYVQKGTVVVL